MRIVDLSIVLAVTSAAAQPPDDAAAADAARTIALNASIQRNNDAIAARNAAAQAAYAEDRAAYEAARAENDQARSAAADAARAYAIEQAAHAKAMAEWQARVAGKAPPPFVDRWHTAAKSADGKPARICSTNLETGSLVKQIRTCGSKDSWSRRRDGEQEAARDLVKRGGDNFDPH